MYKILIILILPIVVFGLEISFVSDDTKLILPKTITKINQIGKELKDKTQVSIYISVSQKALDPKIKAHSKKIANKIDKFYLSQSILISLALDIQKIAIISSLPKKDAFDSDIILNDYIIPFLVGHDKNSVQSKYSAGLLNGYSQLAEDIAEKRNITLENTIKNGSKDVFDAIRIFVYIAIALLFGLILYRKFQKSK